MCMDGNGNIFIAEANNCIRKIDHVTGLVSTWAGSGIAGWKDGFGDTAQFRNPSDICVDISGNVYVSDFENHCIRKIDTNRMVTTIAGNGFAGFQDGTSNARFAYPRGICIDPGGNIFVGDSWNHRIRRIDSLGNVSTYAGGGIFGLSTTGALSDGQDTSARFYTPCGLTIDLQGNIYVADAYNHRIRKIDPSRMVTTLAGSGPTGQGMGGYQNGSFGTAIFNTPTEVFFDTVQNTLYISDTFSSRIRAADLATSTVSNVAGTGSGGYTNGPDSIAAFNYPRAIVTGTSGEIFICDFNNNSIRRIGSDSGLSIDEVEKNEIRIYPNPSSGIFTILFSNYMNHTVVVHDFCGRSIRRLSVYGETRLDLSEFERGVYYIQVDGKRIFPVLVN